MFTYSPTRSDEPGVTRIVWLFSMVHGYSRLIWARFIIHQDLQSVLRCHIAALEAGELNLEPGENRARSRRAR